MLESGAAGQGRLQKGIVGVLKGPLCDGVVIEGANLVVITETDLTGNRGTPGDGKRLAAKRRNTVDPLALSAGDLVVHDQHGIGRFVEMVERTVGGARREYLVLEYASSRRGGGSDKLFVPMDSLDQLSRYVGGQAPALSRLGGSDWANTKTKARRAVREIAGELVSLYAKRQASPGHAFAPDTPWQAEMEDAFGFTETMDQLTAITEVKADMEASRADGPGDLRRRRLRQDRAGAAGRLQGGRRTASRWPCWCPPRSSPAALPDLLGALRPFPVTVHQLSRFCTEEEQRATLMGLRAGTVDIVIGTHRLLQRDVEFRNLGLVVVDEEQRFGVLQKERFKAAADAVDVLSLRPPRSRARCTSRWPDPRHLGIQTPPEERQPVKTYVGPRAAGRRRGTPGAAPGWPGLLRPQPGADHRRDAERLRELVPEARIAVAHGQMHEDLLERGDAGVLEPASYDVLVCTTIVETGLDIPNANT